MSPAARRMALFCDATDSAQAAAAELRARLRFVPEAEAEMGVVLGGDGFMLDILHEVLGRDFPLYGMNRGSVGFLLNGYAADALPARVAAAVPVSLYPLHLRAVCADGSVIEAYAINEVSLFRKGAQAASLDIAIDGTAQMHAMVCDGICIATPAGSTAYNFALNGPVLPLRANVLALTPISVFRPRRWRGAILPSNAVIDITVQESEKRPVNVTTDSEIIEDVVRAQIVEDRARHAALLFDPDHSLEDRIFKEQFMV